MTTLKPQLIRADTLDLQDQDAPSAKDHTRQPSHPGPFGTGPAAPHQSQTLRNAEQDAMQAQKFSPVVSPRASEEQMHAGHPEEPEFYDDHSDTDDQEPSTAHDHHAGELDHDSGIEDGEMSNEGDDDSLDDDMMDKISSSPSIDDGKYTLPVMWPPRKDSVDSGATQSPFSTPVRGKPNSSSPFTSTPEHFPLSMIQEKDASPASHQGGYAAPYDNRLSVWILKSDPTSETSPTAPQSLARYQESPAEHDEYTFDLEMQDMDSYLLPVDDPLLNDNFDDGLDGSVYHDDDDDSDWEDEDVNDPAKTEPSSDDDTVDFQFTDDSRFIDSGWGGECLRETEDIDFEFVYALHTFVATVEGQANATKGDTMVLLDDSNSYWWLVRVVKDGSIGYLPAEHIETPTERLARLNKHRNIDLSATMLGDNPEKSKNPLKKAMRRRNAKTVQFAPPQYFEPSDYEYSDEEEEGHDAQGNLVVNGVQRDGQETNQGTDSDSAVVAPLKINTQQSGTSTNGIERIRSNESLTSDKQVSPEREKIQDELEGDEALDNANTRARRGPVRNTDSFYKDDSVETKKISLTPRLLRGDSDPNVPVESPEKRDRPSLEAFDRMVAADDEKPKDDKKKKEKKGMLSGLFKRKEKKPKAGEVDNDDGEKLSEESGRISEQSRESQDSLNGRSGVSPQRQTSKLQKQPPVKVASKVSQESLRRDISSPASTDPKSPTSPIAQILPATVRSIGPEPANGPSIYATQPSIQENAQSRSVAPTVSPTEKRSFFSPITTALKSSSSSTSLDGEPVVKVKAKKAKHRFEIDAADSEDESAPESATRHHRDVSPLESVRLGGQEEGRPALGTNVPPAVDPVEEHLPPLSPSPPPVVDTPSASEPPSMSPPSPSRSSTPSLTDVDTTNEPGRPTDTTATSPRVDSHTPSTTRSTPTWSDASLRNYMDNDRDIRDMLMIVHDKSNVIPAGSDHPITGHLFATEKGRLTEMQNNLDSMLTSWLSRKNTTLLST